MQIVKNQKCFKHNEDVNFMCTKIQCFKEMNILICKSCFKDHRQHYSDVIQINLLNSKVHALMKKRMDYEETYQKACDWMIKQLKIFKSFKEELVTRLNSRERFLNELCKKIRRHIPYEKDQNLFKNHLGHIYLSMRGINQNYQLYKNFKKTLNDEIAQLKKSVMRLEINLIEQNLLLMKKDHQICQIVKKLPQYQGIKDISFNEAKVKKFKREIIKFKSKQQFAPSIYRLNEQEFLTYNNKHQVVRWYHSKNPLFPRLIPFRSPIQNLTVMGKNAFCSLPNGGIKIFDLLNQRIVKQYASSNQKNAKICDLLTINNNSVISFITCPNQVIYFRFDQNKQLLETVKGIEIQNRIFKSLLQEDRFYAISDDFKLKSYNIETFDQEFVMKFEAPMKTLSKYNQQALIIGGQSNKLNLIDLRSKKKINEIKINGFCNQIEKINDNNFIYSSGRSIRMLDTRILKDTFQSQAEQFEIKNIKVMNSSMFLTSSNALNIWKMME